MEIERHSEGRNEMETRREETTAGQAEEKVGTDEPENQLPDTWGC